MDAMSIVAVCIFGLLIGMMLWSRIMRTFVAIFDKRLSRTTGPFGVQKTRVWRLIALFSSVWVLTFGLIISHFLHAAASVSGWKWFFIGMASTPAFVIAFAFKMVRRMEARAKAKDAAISVERVSE